MTCTIPASVLRISPFDLITSDSVYARVTAINALGESSTSLEGNGATLPIPPTEPDAPTTLAKLSSSKTHVTFSWTAPADNGGSAVLDYSIEMDSNDDNYTEVASGVTMTSHT